MKYPKRKNLTKIPRLGTAAAQPLTNDWPHLRPLYLPQTNVLTPLKVSPTVEQKVNIPTMDIAPTNTNTDTRPQNTVTKRSHHRKATTGQSQPIGTLGKSDSSPGPKRKATSVRVNPARLKAVTEGVTSLYATVGIFAYARDQYDGLIIMTTAPERATELVNVAKHHKWLMDLLIRLTQSSDYVTLAIGHAGMIYALMAHHNQIPKNEALLAQFGYTEQQVATKAAMMQAQAGQPSQPDVEAQYEAMEQQEPQPYDIVTDNEGASASYGVNGVNQPNAQPVL